jgi:DNA replication protein DnaC
MATAAELITNALGFAPPEGIVPMTPDQLQQYKIASWNLWVRQSLEASTKARQARLTTAYQSVGIPKRYRSLTLDTFAAESAGDSQKQIALAKVRRYLGTGSLNGKSSLLFWNAERGVGKTGLATSLFSAIIAKTDAPQALWLDYGNLLDVIRQGFRPNATVDPYELQRNAARTPLLLLDHFGSNIRPDVSEAVAEITAKIINHRHSDELPTLITTNLSPAELQMQLGEDTYQRLAEMAEWIKVEGRVLRNLG